jgi:hypothetical protein
MKKVVNQLRRMDIFGTSMNFSVKQEDQYRTFIGALVSIAIQLFCLSLFALLFNDLLNYSNPILIANVEFD